MKVFKNKVAVVTGAASGIGFAIAEQCAKKGMKVVLADIERPSLFLAEKKLKLITPDIISVLTDVSKYSDIERLAKVTLDVFRSVHILFNNAGVGVPGNLWEKTLNDWKWVLKVNLYGVFYGVKVFVPIMLTQNTECLIVNTASGYSLIPGSGIYGISKYGILALSEILSNQLKQIKSKIKVSVLIPMNTKTNIINSERNRPKHLKNNDRKINEEVKRLIKIRRKIYDQGIAPETVSEILFKNLEKENFYIITSTLVRPMFKKRMRKILKAFTSIE